MNDAGNREAQMAHLFDPAPRRRLTKRAQKKKSSRAKVVKLTPQQRRELDDLVRFTEAHGGRRALRPLRPYYSVKAAKPRETSEPPESTDEPGSASTARDGRSRLPFSR